MSTLLADRLGVRSSAGNMAAVRKKKRAPDRKGVPTPRWQKLRLLLAFKHQLDLVALWVDDGHPVLSRNELVALQFRNLLHHPFREAVNLRTPRNRGALGQVPQSQCAAAVHV